MENWSTVYKTSNSSRAAIVKGVLHEKGVDAVILNKSDSTLHMPHGQVEVSVPADMVLRAIKIVNDEIAFK